MIQGSSEWIQMRRNYIGASDAPVIMGVSPYKTKRQLWEEKLGLLNDNADNPGIRYGRAMEEPARQAYERHTGILVAPAVVFHKERSYMMASLDGLSLDKSIAVEIKNVNTEDHRMAKDGKVPEKYYPQVQHQLAVLDIDVLHYFSYRNGDFALIEVLKDNEYLEQLYSSEASFWSLVTNFQEPELSGKDFITIEDEQWVNVVSEWKAANEQLKELAAKEKQFRQSLIEMADSKNVICGGVKLTKVTKRGAVDYSKIKELEGVDLEQYRKDPVTSWRIS